MSDKIKCEECGAEVHVMQKHLSDNHPDISLESYKSRFPNAPLLSQLALDKLAEKRALQAANNPELAVAAMAGGAPAGASVTTLVPKGTPQPKAFHETFKLGKVKAALSAKGEPIPIKVLTDGDFQDMVPVPSDDYVWDIDELKNVILGIEMNIPTYVWGHKGSGKSEMFENICGRTNRPFIRVQHSVNTEESHIVGQWTVKGGETVFELGPLPLAMINGWMYLADEYDFALPSVLSVYQAALEPGKSLVIKEAPAHLRIIKPHPNFRIVATGNTNGSGDETGLYQGTNIQNSANYDRFGVVVHKVYMDKKAESLILQQRVGLVEDDAKKMVEFASLVRESYDGGKISDTVSPRTLIYASQIGVKRGSFRTGLTLSFINKLSQVDREVVNALAQRVFA
jgi:cobaltochelatase CobS